MYAALAYSLDSPLITWDKQMLERAADLVHTRTPASVDPAL